MFRSVSLVLLGAGLATVSSIAAGQDQTQRREPSAQQQLLGFGPQLLSEEEQAAYRARIRKAKTAQESESVRAEHYQLMWVRAREKGIALPEQRPPVGGSLGPQLTTEDARAAYRARIRSAKTKEAFEQVRSQQREEIVTPAKEKGIILPPAPAAAAGSAGGAAVGSAAAFGTLFGPQLMTEEEQVAYRARLRAATTSEERQKIRDEHRRQLQVRAKAKGVVLP